MKTLFNTMKILELIVLVFALISTGISGMMVFVNEYDGKTSVGSYILYSLTVLLWIALIILIIKS